ncbi:AbgT family transporter [Paracoccus sp. NGMCC 1.201697]|uniref:AbgT family transporter n=1 Tax=Paracoccus broussonetiae subsp. drimophilus TaxID=3373869 RepID=A0ABW7LPJ9_9RHOB
MDETRALRSNIFDRLENIINRLPEPFTLLIVLAALTALLSLPLAGVSLSFSTVDPATGQEVAKTVAIENILTAPYFANLLVEFPKLLVGFPPIALTLVVMMGISVAEHSGFLSSVIRGLMRRVPKFAVISVVSFLAINGDVFGDAAMFVLMPLAATLFFQMGLNPWLGIILVFVGNTAGFSASLVINQTDTVLSGITASVLPPEVAEAANISPIMNWYFNAFSALTATAAMVLVTYFLVPSKLAPNKVGELEIAPEIVEETPSEHGNEGRGLIAAGIFTVLYLAAILAMLLPEGGALRGEGGQIVPKSPFMGGIVVLISLYFALSGIVFGWFTGRMKSLGQAADWMKNGISSMSFFLVVSAAAVVFLKFFNDSHIGEYIGSYGVVMLQGIQASPGVAIFLFLLLVSVSNLFIISGSVLWVMYAPIFVPLMLALGYTPAATQMIYRIGDAPLNAVCPVNPFLILVIGLLNKWRPKGTEPVKVGTPLVLAMPYALAILGVLVIQLVFWVLWDLPPGPGATLMVR